MEPLELFTHRQILTVSELVGQLKKATEEAFDFVWVKGEISGLRRPGSGHVYFALKDQDAMLRAVMFRHQAGLLRFALEEGQEVLCQGRLSVYQPRGEVQLVVDLVEPRGAGALALAFEQTKKRLAAEGLFDEARKRPLPDLPLRVAVVTSPQGAALRDFLHVLHKRYERIAVAIYPVLVQGDHAPGQMIQALGDLAEWGWPQVIVLTRGGGSPEDLWAFNDEALARAIAASPIPVVSAVGHEIDVSISDLVADLRAPTPTAAAELIAAPLAQRAERLRGIAARLMGSARRLVSLRQEQLRGLRRGLGDPRRRLADRRLRVDDLMLRAAAALKASIHAKERRIWNARSGLRASRADQRLAKVRARFQAVVPRLATALSAQLHKKAAHLDRLRTGLQALGPLAVLGRGYALVTGGDGSVLRRASDSAPGRKITVRLAQGSLRAKVEKVSE